MRHIRTDGSAEPSCGAIAARITVNTAARPHRPDDIFVREVCYPREAASTPFSSYPFSFQNSPRKNNFLSFYYCSQQTWYLEPCPRSKHSKDAFTTP